MKKSLLILLVLVTVKLNIKAQNIFPVKLDNCITNTFCLDCGDEKAGVNTNEFNNLVNKLNKTNGSDYRKVNGKILFQVLVDSTGNGCVLSHTDASDSPTSASIVRALNLFTGWIPAKENGKTVGRTSINISAEIKNGVLTASVARVDMNAFRRSFEARDPEIYNKSYAYTNENLKNYNIKFWNSKNSNLPDNFNDHIAIDANNTVWLTTEQNLVKFTGSSFIPAGQYVSDNNKVPFVYHTIIADNKNIKWTCIKDDIYSFNGDKWTKYDSTTTGSSGTYSIINNTKSAEVFFCSDKGLTIYKNGTWNTINKAKVKELPSDRVYFAKRDSKNRIWVGTFSGSVLLDENGKAISYNNTATVLKNKCITSMDEDENGNVYLGLFEYDRKDKKSLNADEGVAICSSNGDIKQFTTDNSGMPFNHVTKVLYDKNEKVLWIATDRAGLVRYDLKGNWENYHNKNSNIPTPYISDMALNSNGVLYLATRQGLVKIERK